MESLLIGNKQGDLKYFDDSIELSSSHPYKIHTLKIFHTSQGIFGIQVYYYSLKTQSLIKCKEHKPSKLFGVSEQKLILENSEYIISLSWYQNEIGINRLEIQTNKNQLSVGIKDGEKKDFKLEQNCQLGAIAGGFKNSLQFVEWQIMPLTEEQTLYTSQLYQMFMSQSEPVIKNEKYEYIGKQYKVCDPQIVEQGLTTKFVQFKVIDSTEKEILRRFQDVWQFRRILQLKWPGIYIPPLMMKPTFDDYSNEFIENMRKSIEYFLIKLSKIPYFVQSVEFGVFITKTNKETQQEMEYVTNKLKEMTQNVSLEQINLRYKQTFEEFETSETVNEAQKQKCLEFSILMQKLEQLKVTDYADIKKLFEQHSKNINYLSKYILPELQILHLNLQQEEIVQRRKSNSIDRGLQMQIDTMNDVYDYFVTEQREASVMTQCMNYIKDLEQQKVKLESKIAGNKFKEEEIPLQKGQLLAISSIWNILVKSYADYYIDTYVIQLFRYFDERYQLYLFMINRLAQIQLNNLKIRQNFWMTI